LSFLSKLPLEVPQTGLLVDWNGGLTVGDLGGLETMGPRRSNGPRRPMKCLQIGRP